jgi:hypothetical protein
MPKDEPRYPWELTLREFIERTREFVRYLTSGDQIRAIALLAGIDPEETLTKTTTASLCRRLGLPLADFGLAGEDDG